MAAVDTALALSCNDSSTSSYAVADTCTTNDAKVSKLHRLLRRRLQLCATENQINIAVEDLITNYRTEEQLTNGTAAMRGTVDSATKYSCYSTTCITRDGPSAAGSCYSPLCRHIQEQEFSCHLRLPEQLEQDMCRLSCAVSDIEDVNLNESSISCDSDTKTSPGLDKSPTKSNGACNQCVHDKQEASKSDQSKDRTKLSDTTKGLMLLVGLLQRHVCSGQIDLTEVLVSRLQSLLDTVTDTRNPVCLRGTVRKSGRKKAEIPVAHDFRTRSGRQSVFVLTASTVRRLARSGGMLFTIPGFSSGVSTKTDFGWIYACPRPLFCTAWLYRTASVRNLSALALQLRVLWCCIRWDDMSTDSPVKDVSVAMETDMVTTTTILRRRDVGHDGLRSEYLVRRVSAPTAAGSDLHGNLAVYLYFIIDN